ncbi:diphosphomevalonate decarboxylase [Aquicella lusitana]|uniref:diphosphomevalonate decarboxylase n=1 Tax=Aquicella lusitana TaxID=254246 RepID=A0A370GPD6_9COXI|nr:diphosphomevalonate decarboxylase [Aquicella lusitana]RDI45180.1 diphosphomevalonate decarboxylase [Aquicella lusitana]VVC72750.1 4-diphosphocytidyl-2-C-methyl-D-erythritol kinase [Aquicella lusitana]
MKKSDVIRAVFHSLLQEAPNKVWQPQHEKGLGFAPTNIALCKYWGKRDIELNLPMTSSLSIALPDKGALTSVSLHDQSYDRIILNDQEVVRDSAFAVRTSQFLDLFRPQKTGYLQIDIKMNIPVAAGLASSACGFASLVSALNDLFDWKLKKQSLSILARLGSGSAARSFWNGFVEWYAGVRPDGMDSFGEPLAFEWPELCVGILTMSEVEKPISSREAMQRTVNSSLLYGSWPKKVAQDLAILKQAMQVTNFPLLGGTAESNALTMHATMLSSWPPVCYFMPETIAAMHKIWKSRKEGLELYFTQDAGPNLKLLFLEQDKEQVQQLFPSVDIVKVFE